MNPSDEATLDAFVRAHTRSVTPPLCPEIALAGVDELTDLWEATEARLGALGIDTPFWGIPWAGGQALARFVLDTPHWVRGRRVLDLGTGSGLCALAAAIAGAAEVVANDPDPVALAATRHNARSNHVQVAILGGDLLDGGWDGKPEVILAADLWFERRLAERVTGWLLERAARGATVLAGDPDRAYFPAAPGAPLARYQVPTSAHVERSTLTAAGVWRLGGPAHW